MEIFGIPSQTFFGQLLLGLINGSFYAVLSLGLAIIFGLLNIINFTHGAPNSSNSRLTTNSPRLSIRLKWRSPSSLRMRAVTTA